MTSEQKTIKVQKSELPASCPPKDSPAWDLHPRVYIELSDEKKSHCPYCGNHFVLEE